MDRLTLLLLLFICVFIGYTQAETHAKWSYHIDSNTGPGKWSELYPEKCGPAKKFQSPINIVTTSTEYLEKLDAIDIIDSTLKVQSEPVEATAPKPEAETEVEDSKPEVDVSATGNHEHAGQDHEGEKMEMSSEDEDASSEDAGKMLLINNGHTAKVSLEKGDVFFASKALGAQYKVAQVHFHWGKNATVGSEHRINGKMFHLEMHVVTYDSEKYSTLTEAVGTKTGLAVFGVLFKKGKHNAVLQNVVDNLKNITKPNSKVEMPWFHLEELLPASLHKYYRYEGSLTTPSCDETVLWTLFDEHPTVCPSQLKHFYNMREGRRADGEPVQLENNFRPPQPLHGRPVYASFTPREKQVKYNIVSDASKDGANSANSIKQRLAYISLSIFCAWVFVRL